MAGLNQTYEPRTGGLESAVTVWSDGILRSYSQVLFSSSRTVGILLVGATFVMPRLGLAGMATVLVGLVTARLLNLPEASFRSGMLTFNSVLVGLGLGAMFEPTPMLVALITVSGIATVALTAALSASLSSTLNLPALTLPFILSIWILHAGALGMYGIESTPVTWDPTASVPELPLFLSSYLKALGALFFMPRVDGGIMVAVALLVASRISLLLSMLGFGVAYIACMWGLQSVTAPVLQNVGFNLMLVAIALGGIWFVPCWSSFALAAVASALAAVFAVSVGNWSAAMGLSPLTLPFVLTVLMALVAMRLRMVDSAPKAVDFTPGSPEQNLDYYQTRLARFGTPLPVAMGLPFLGRWICTQGNDGPHTHQGPWRHGLDFEVKGVDGRTFTGDGRRVEDYLCWRLPVTAVADGTVVRVVADVPDNPIGEVASKENWGNLVLIHHAPNLYSLTAHLAQGSITVAVGTVVRRGATVGLCGSSGRSPVPHVHVQLQSSDVIGSPTRPIQFCDVVAVGNDGGESVVSRLTPAEGQTVRNLIRDEATAAMCSWQMGEPLVFKLAIGDADSITQTLVPEMDLLGAKRLSCRESNDVLWYEDRLNVFTVYDQSGQRDSVLGLMRMAVPRVPYDALPGLAWQDALILRQMRSALALALRDFVSPFIRSGGMVMDYRYEQEGDCWCVVGRSRKMRRGRPSVVTRARFRGSVGLESIEAVVDGKKITAVRI